MAVNHLTYQGRFVDAPQCGQSNNGTDYANFRLAWNKRFRERETKCFLDCKAFSGTAQFIQRNMNQKGMEIIVEGELNTEEWTTQEGQKRSKIVLIVNSVHFCGKRDGGSTGEHAEPEQAQPGIAEASTPVDTEELPF